MRPAYIWPLCVALALPGSVLAAEERITWDDGICTNEIRFSPRRHDRQALQNTIDIAFRDLYSPLNGIFLPAATPKRIAELDLEQHQAYCRNLIQQYERMSFVDLPGASEMKEALVGYTRETCFVEGLRARALKGEVGALREYAVALPQCSRYIDALEGKADFGEVWQELVQRICAGNGNVSACEAEFQAERAASDGGEQARISMIRFGWGNCANRLRDGTHDKLRKASALVRVGMKRFRYRQMNCAH